MIKDVRNYINTVGNRLSKAFSIEDFGTEEELVFWSLSAEHMSRKEVPTFTEITQWINLLYNAPVHFVYRLEGDKLLLDRRHIISENILNEKGEDKMPHEQSPQQKDYIQNFENQVLNIEKKIDWDDEFAEHGISSHSIGQCEHIPLYTKKGDIWGVYLVGPYIRSPKTMAPKMSIVGRILSSWLIELQESEEKDKKSYSTRIDEITSNLGVGKLNTKGLSQLTIRYVVNALYAKSGAVIEYKENKNTFSLISQIGFDEDFLSYFDQGDSESLFSSEGNKIILSEAGEAFFELQKKHIEILEFKGGKTSGCMLIIKGSDKPLYNIEPVLDNIITSVSRLLDYREDNTRFSDEYLDTYYRMLRAIERSREKTMYHTPRMIAFAQRFGMIFGLEPQEMEIIKKTARFHDIGYVGATGLEKGKTIGGELSHPVIGAKLLEQLPIEDDIVKGIKTHHEWVNGSGSPDGLTGDQIPWTGKIIGVFEYVVEFIETNANDSSKTPDEWMKLLTQGVMERADKNFDMVLVPTVIQLLQMLGWESCCTLGVEE